MGFFRLLFAYGKSEEIFSLYESIRYPGLEPTKPGEKPRVVILEFSLAFFRRTLEFRSVAEPISQVQPALVANPQFKYEITLVVANPPCFSLRIFSFAKSHPLSIKEHAYLLREVNHAQEIRKRLLFMLSENPAGPTRVEFSSELSDFIMKDVRERFPHVEDYIQVTLIESSVHLKRGVVKEVQVKKIILNNGTDVPYGLLVRSTGVGPSEFIKSLDLPKSPGGRIGVDKWLRVPSVEDVFALGRPVAKREGKFLEELFRRIGKQNGGKAFCSKDIPLGDPFVYRHLGSMDSVGRYKVLVDLRQAKGISHARFMSWLVWHLAYLTRVVSWRNKFYVAVNWATTLVFGRDNSRIG
ncbi:hypothetical protein ACJRO7_021485 [Eucalyptus globulus]|uniref:NADH:ubiquinone reductase (non-electrogenic) n=1 Tax=Eucalyptus globulus TaxID=34317 RepID=A0ABD3KMI9_EUCGL